MNRLIQEGALLTGVSLSGVTAATTDGSLKSLIPLVVGALVRLVQAITTKEEEMADLTALTTSVANLEAATSAVSAEIATLKAGANDQPAVDALAARVDTATAALNVAATP